MLSCRSTYQFREDEISAVLDAYTRATASSTTTIEADSVHGINRLELTTSPSGEALLSIDVEQADVSAVIRKIFEQSGTPYLMQTIPRGRVTGQFEQKELLEGINLLLRSASHAAEWLDGVVLIRGTGITPRPVGSQPVAAERRADAAGNGNPDLSDLSQPESPNASASMEAQFPLRWIDATAAAATLTTLFPFGTGPQFGANPANNSIYLIGSEETVRKGISALNATDIEPAHVLIEALIVEVDVNYLRKVNVDIRRAGLGQFSDIAVLFGRVLADTITFTFDEGANTNLKFDALIEALEIDDRARLISRPYITTISGSAATINITQNQYVIVETAINGATITTPQPITVGAILNITPIVTALDLIRMTLSVEDSHFVASTGNITAQTNREAATTTMLVKSGQSIIIGGLAVDTRSALSSGFPFLRRVPILNLLTGTHGDQHARRDLIMVITPHIVTPGMKVPVFRKPLMAPKIEDQPDVVKNPGP